VSFSFYVSAKEPPRFSALVDALREPDWACPEDPPDGDRFPEGFFFHPYRVGRAARGIELGLEDGRFQVRILTCSSRADYELGVRVTDTLAQMMASPVHPEDGDPMPRDEAWDAYDDAWIDRMVAWGPRVTMAMVDEKMQMLTMAGPRRSFCLGPRFLAELRADSGDNLGERILEAMIQLQSVDAERYYAASVMRVSPKEEGGTSFTVTAWGPDVAYLFPDVEYLALVGSNDHLLVPSAAGPKIARERWRYLDEKNALVEATPAREWSALVASAQSFATEPGRDRRVLH
jgi:hypothetical protein